MKKGPSRAPPGGLRAGPGPARGPGPGLGPGPAGGQGAGQGPGAGAGPGDGTWPYLAKIGGLGLFLAKTAEKGRFWRFRDLKCAFSKANVRLTPPVGPTEMLFRSFVFHEESSIQ